MVKESIEIMCCYALKDQQFLIELKAHLSPLHRQGLITLWTDIEINAGSEWESEISHHLDQAKIILLLVSPDFIASEYSYSKEMKRALERHERQEARVIPIILRPTLWSKVPHLAMLQVLPRDAKPVTLWTDHDIPFLEIADNIGKVANELLGDSEEVKNVVASIRNPGASMGKAGEDCLDLELEIGPGRGGEYPIGVIHSVAGEARETMHFPFTAPLELENQLMKLKIALFSSQNIHRLMLSHEEQTVQEFGSALFRALFTGKVLNCYSNSCYAAKSQEKRLRLKLRILAPDLVALPWEFLYDPEIGNYLCLSRNTPIVRYMELPLPPKPLTVNLPLRILGMIAAPCDLDTLNVESERSRIERALSPLIKKHLVELVWTAHPTLQGLMADLLPSRGPWHIFHFIGHGTFDLRKDEGQIALEDEDRNAYLLSARKLASLLADHLSLRLVVLNACEGARGGTRDLLSSTASVLVHKGIPAVLAMQYAITDKASITLSETFYKTLVEGLPVDIAVGEARKALSIMHTLEWGTPVLYMRTSHGVLFKIKEEVDSNDRQIKASKSDVHNHEPETKETDEVKVPIDISPSRSSLEPSDMPAFPVFFPVPPDKPLCQMAVYLVTNHEFRAFVDANPYWQPGKQCYREHKVDDQYLDHWTDNSEELAKYPVVNVSWYAAQAYINWLKEQLNIPLRFSTREEWEISAYAGRIWEGWLQQELKAGRVNYKDTHRVITPVGLFNPNPYGLFDILGNVYELCTTKEGIYACGGAFHCSAEQLIHPVEVDPNQCSEDIGFRLVLELS